MKMSEGLAGKDIKNNKITLKGKLKGEKKLREG